MFEHDARRNRSTDKTVAYRGALRQGGGESAAKRVAASSFVYDIRRERLALVTLVRSRIIHHRTARPAPQTTYRRPSFAHGFDQILRRHPVALRKETPRLALIRRENITHGNEIFQIFPR